jgi:hypothetical protein
MWKIRAIPNYSERVYLKMDVGKFHERELSYIFSQWFRLIAENHADHKPLETNGPTRLLCGGEWKPSLREASRRTTNIAGIPDIGRVTSDLRQSPSKSVRGLQSGFGRMQRQKSVK